MATVRLKMNKPETISKRILYNDKVGLFFAQTCAKEMKPYVPARDRHLMNSATYEPDSSSGKKQYIVVYQATGKGGGTSYAKYQWRGLSKSGKKLNYYQGVNPKATSK